MASKEAYVKSIDQNQCFFLALMNYSNAKYESHKETRSTSLRIVITMPQLSQSMDVTKPQLQQCYGCNNTTVVTMPGCNNATVVTILRL